MASANQILDAFAKAESRERIELMVLMCRLLTPTELRFVLTCLEDLAASSLRNYQKVEFEANDCKRLSSISKPEATLDEIVGQAVLFTSFLKRDNINGARLMTRILEDVMCRVELIGCTSSGDLSSKENSDRFASELEVTLIGDLLLLFSMASHHSAFSFNSRLRLHDYLRRLHGLFDQPDLGLSTEQSMAGSSIFSSLESVELASDGGALTSASSSNNQNGTSSESSENHLNTEKVVESNIPYHVMVSPKNSDIVQESQYSKAAGKISQGAKYVPVTSSTSPEISSQTTEVQSHDIAKDCSGHHSNLEVAKNSKANASESRHSSNRASCIDAKVLENACTIQDHQNQVAINLSDDIHREGKLTSCERPNELWPQSLPLKSVPAVLSSCISNPQSPADIVPKPHFSALLDKLFSSNILNDADVEFVKEKRRSLGGNANQKPLLTTCPMQNGVSDASTPIRDFQAKNTSPLDSSIIESSVKDIDDSCNLSQVEGELSQSFLPDLLDFKDDTMTVKQPSDRRSSMPPYLPSSLLPMFKEEAEDKKWAEGKLSGEDDNKRHCVDSTETRKNSERRSSTIDRGFLQDLSPVEASSNDINTPISNSSSRSYKNNGSRNIYGHQRNRNGNHSMNHRGLTDYPKHQMNGVGGYDSNAQSRTYYYRGNGRNVNSHGEHKSGRQNIFNWNGNNSSNNNNQFQQNRLPHMSTGTLQHQAQSQSTFQQQYHQAFLNNQPQQQPQIHNQLQPQSSSKSSGSPPGAFNMQHLNVATTMAQPTQGFYTHYLTPYPAEFAQAVYNPYYAFRAGLHSQATIINRTGSASAYSNNATNGNGSLRFHSSIPRGMTPSFYVSGAPLVMATFQSNNGIQQLVCPEQVGGQSSQACFYDPSVPPPPLTNPPSMATYPPQVMLYDRGSVIDTSGKLMCPNCASSEHSFNNCPHSLPSIPR